MDKDLFIARYESLRRRHRMVVIVALLPFFGALVWFLFLTNYPTRLVQSFAAVTAGLLVAALCFGGIWATKLAKFSVTTWPRLAPSDELRNRVRRVLQPMLECIRSI